MTKSVSVAISDAAITRALADEGVVELRDTKQPIALKIQSNRQKGTWYLVQYQNRQKKRVRAGYYPSLKTKDVVAMVPELIRKLHAGEEPAADRFETVGQLLEWYRNRTSRDRSKSLLWRKSVESAVKSQLLPRLADLAIANLTKSSVDNLLIMPLIADGLQASTVRKYWGVLKTAIAVAAKMDLLNRDYMAGWKFVDHVTKRILPKESRLLINSLPMVMQQLQKVSGLAWGLVAFMLAYGTRIGETRQLRWSHIDLISRLIVIPAELTKTNVTHVLPITDLAAAILAVIEQQSGGKREYLFQAGSEPISTQQAQDLVRSLSSGRWSAHDLRKLARTSWAELKIDYWLAERLLNHKPRGLDAVYIKTDGIEQRLTALNTYHEWLKTNGFHAGTTQALNKTGKA